MSADVGLNILLKETKNSWARAYLTLGTLAGSLDPIAAFDNIRLQAYRTRPTVQFQE